MRAKMTRRLSALESAAAQATLEKLRTRRGSMRFVIVDKNAIPDGRGGWYSDTLQALGDLPSELYMQGLLAIGDDGDIEVRPE